MFIYDIYLNFNKEFYDFYDWKETDDITHIRKIPLLRVSTKLYNLIISNNVKININDISYILNKTEIYKNRKVNYIEYSFIATTGVNSCAIILDKEGNISKISSIELEDELEISDIGINLKELEITYKEKHNNTELNILTRDKKEKINYILNIIKLNKKNNEKLKYLYYEWNNKEYKGDNCYLDLIKTIKSNCSNKSEDFINIINLIKNV